MRLAVAVHTGRRRSGALIGPGFRPFRRPFDGLEPAELAARPDLTELLSAEPLSQASLALPVTPTAVFCADDNYRDQPHPRRAGLARQRPAALAPLLTGAAIEDVLITAIDPLSLVADGADVIRPRGCDRLDVGVTLAAVVGGAPPRVVAFAAALDFARFDVPPQQAYLARSFPTHTVLGAAVLTRDEVPDAGGLAVRLAVDGELRQCGQTTDMIADADELVAAIARRYPLRPGDIVLTGSPAGRPADTGTGWVSVGSGVAGWIGGVGAVATRVVAERVVDRRDAG